jgi:Kdo2-lipid IVA lauroyltransferase/acyltransferase
MKNPFLKEIRNFFFYILVQILRFIVFFIPWKAGSKAGEALGLLVYCLAKKETAKVHKNLDMVFGGKMNAAEKEKFVKENFKNYGIGLFEFMKATLWKPEKTASLVKEVTGFEHYENAKKQGRGVLSITAHYSNWEIIPVYIATHGMKVGVIGKRLFDDRLDRLLNASRVKAGITVFDRENISKTMIKELKCGLALGILVDQDTRVESVIAPFLGHDAKTPVIPARLAKKFGFLILTLFLVRRPDGYYKLIINKPYDLTGKESELDIARMYNNDISRIIMEDPVQWAWVHERWKSVL